MQRFFRTYGRALGFLGTHRLATVALCTANLALAGMGFMEPMLFGHIIQGLAESGPYSGYLLLWAGVGVLGVVAGMATSLVADRMSHRLRMRVMGQAYANVLRLPPEYHARHPTGSLMKILWTGADDLFTLWLGLFREHLVTAFYLAGLLPLAMFLNPALGCVLAALAVVFAATVSLAVRRTRDGQRRAEDAHTAMSTQVGDVLGNARLIQAFGRTSTEIDSFGTLASDALRHQFPVLGWWAGVSVMSRAASTVATMAVIVLGAWLHGQGRASMADIVTFMGFAGILISRLESAVASLHNMSGNVPRLEDFFSMLDAHGAILDPADRPDLPPGPGSVEFRSVHFSYPGSASVLNGVDFMARPGETVALVGATGSGKSTAMALLQRLWDPAAGAVLVDGHDARTVSLASLQSRIGIVPQETLLLNRTIRENLLIGDPDATPAELEHAARLAEAHDFIVSQPQGYDTVVGERGVALSGGQRQRLAIARALLRDPRILILDEATSALDGLTEEKVVRAMKTAATGRTTFVIAHRLATIRDADRILFFHDGVVAETGTFEELVARGGAFAELSRTQFPTSDDAPMREEMRSAGSRPRLVYSRPEPDDMALEEAPAELENARSATAMT